MEPDKIASQDALENALRAARELWYDALAESYDGDPLGASTRLMERWTMRGCDESEGSD